jgi:hypothetical protein
VIEDKGTGVFSNRYEKSLFHALLQVAERLLNSFPTMLRNRLASTIASFSRIEDLALKKEQNRNPHRGHLALHPPPTLLLLALTLSAGECRVGGGKLKMSRRGGPVSQSTRSSLEAQNGIRLFFVAF